MILEGPGGLRAVIFRSQIAPKTCCCALGARIARIRPQDASEIGLGSLRGREQKSWDPPRERLGAKS